MGADAGDAERRTASGSDDAPAAAGPGSTARSSPATLRAYRTDWAGFRDWCRAEKRAPLPADPHAVAAHIEALAPTHGGAALRRRVAAIGFHHRLSEAAWDASHPAIRAALRALGRGHAPRRPRRRVATPTAPELPRLLAACGADLAGLRDRALLLLAVAGGLDRAELVGLDREHVRDVPGGLELLVARAAGDAGRDDVDDAPDPAAARAVAVPSGAAPETCPVRALRTWFDVSGCRFGPVFRKVDRWGNIEHDRLGADAVRRVLLRRRAEAARARQGAKAVHTPGPGLGVKPMGETPFRPRRGGG